MRRTILTVAMIDKAIRDLQPGNRIELRDAMTPGLYLGIGALRSTWSLRHKPPHAEQTKVRLGYYPLMSLAQARTEAQQRRLTALAAIPLASPVHARQQPPQPILAPTDNTLTFLLDLYQKIQTEDGKDWSKGRQAIENVFRAELQTPLSSLTTITLQRYVDAHPSKASAGTALGYLKPALKYATKRGWTTLDPTYLDRPKGANKPRERVLTTAELKLILPALTFDGYDAAVRLLLLTMCRREEVAQARWEEFELVDGGQSVWTIPAARYKTSKLLQVPLPTQAVQALRALGGAVSGPILPRLDQWNRYQKKLNERTGTSGWQRHDLRRTGATVLGGLGVTPHVIEACLGHATLHSSLAGVYNQSRYTNEHARALQLLADYYEKVSA